MMTPGMKLGGRYRLDERIATGGMGDVWRATDEVLGREVAAKVLLPSLLNEPGFIERFRGEARVVATLTHPNIVRVYDYGESPLQGGGQVAYLVMEFVSGESLTARLQREGRLSAEQALPIVAQAAEALDAAHQAGVVHRDVKPGNLLLQPNGTVMLTDFGIARSALTGGLTQAGSVLGTAAYISPEQASGNPVTGQSDVYSLGIVAYQCLAGRRPFDSDNPVELAMRHMNDEPPPLPDDVPETARAFVASALAKDPAQRFATGEAMAQAARVAVGLAPGSPVTPTSPAPAVTDTSMTVPAPAQQPMAPRGSATPPPGRGLDVDPTSLNPEVSPHTPAPAQRRNKMLLMVAGATLLVVVLVATVWAIAAGTGGDDQAGDDGKDKTSESKQSDGEEDDGKIEIKTEDYLNKPPQQVKAALEKLGFKKVTVDGIGLYTSDITPDGKQDPTTPIKVSASRTRVEGGDNGSQTPGDTGGPSQSGGGTGPSKSCKPPGLGCKP